MPRPTVDVRQDAARFLQRYGSLSRTTIARRTGLSHTTVARLQRGETCFTTPVAFRIHEAVQAAPDHTHTILQAFLDGAGLKELRQTGFSEELIEQSLRYGLMGGYGASPED